MKLQKKLLEKKIELRESKINGGRLRPSHQQSVAQTGEPENPDTCTDIGFDQPAPATPVGYDFR
ncbi:hypothetical protein C7T94_08365 [Pedobacter yulinensis]|uniref:Uncharacterized protein n=1 Tax=Pedobacter yulinensis TaxID=2126353 RepID=A0A2T3HJN2_9SPHI|nr:hypothetical protein [Pedobacter yulinensis]PST82665.1 hypothetical protein C7T94_08365 [Pedobacter yulinensis]